jgi:hypothetical protein
MGFETPLMSELGEYSLTIESAGERVTRTFLAVDPSLGRAYDRHQQQRLGAYTLAGRAAVRFVPVPGAAPALTHRAIFRRDARTLTVDVSESVSDGAVWGAYLAQGRLAAAPTVPMFGGAIVLLETNDGFEAVWPSGSSLVRVRGPGLRDDERAILRHYLSVNPSRLGK